MDMQYTPSQRECSSHRLLDTVWLLIRMDVRSSVASIDTHEGQKLNEHLWLNYSGVCLLKDSNNDENPYFYEWHICRDLKGPKYIIVPILQ